MFREIVEDLGDFVIYRLIFRGYSRVVLGVGEGGDGYSKGFVKSYIGVKVWEMENYLKLLNY